MLPGRAAWEGWQEEWVSFDVWRDGVEDQSFGLRRLSTKTRMGNTEVEDVG